MRKWYNEHDQMDFIEMIFKKIILKTLGNEYSKITTYDTQSDDCNYVYQNAVFNLSDIMCCIFQFLRCFEDLVS